MEIIIIEDEKSNSKRLIELLRNIDNELKVLAILESIEDSVDWFVKNGQPELVFMDVQLSDGLCFQIFESIEIEAPIIFTTAYDEYAIKAFKVNSIDYLLKPIDPIELEVSILKYKKIFRTKHNDAKLNLLKLIDDLAIQKAKYKTRILLKSGKSFSSVPVEQIAYIIIENQLINLFEQSGNKFILDGYLDDIEKDFNPSIFFRINRQMLINFTSIKKIINYQGSRLKLVLTPPANKEIIVSREKVAGFKEWLNR